jgi:PTS system nitrogen regulatory IIA component
MLGDLLHPKRVRVGVQLVGKESALRSIASLLTMPEEVANEETVYEVLLDRERLASTGIGSGVAIPHGRYDGVDELRAAVAVCPDGVEFEAVDQLPVHIVVGIVGPRSMPQKHLAALAGVSRALRSDTRRAALLKATDDAEAYRVLTEP